MDDNDVMMLCMQAGAILILIALVLHILRLIC